MLITSTDLSDTDTVKSRDFKGRISLRALHWIETALAVMVIATADHIALAREEQRVGASAAHLDNFFIQHVKSFQSLRETRSKVLSIA